MTEEQRVREPHRCVNLVWSDPDREGRVLRKQFCWNGPFEGSQREFVIQEITKFINEADFDGDQNVSLSITPALEDLPSNAHV